MNAEEFEERFNSLTDTISSIADSQQNLAERVDSLASEFNDAEEADSEDADEPTVEERTADLVMERLENSGLDLSEDADEDAEAEAEDEPTVEDLAADIESIGEQLTETQDALSEASATIERVAKSDGVSQQETNISDEELLKALAEQAGGPNEDNRSKAQVFGAEKVAE
jgi:chromosome segregation ATPase